MNQADTNQLDWRIIQRWQEFVAETRTNLIRAVSIGVFYSIQFFYFNFGEIAESELERARQFHQQCTLLSAAWFTLVLAIALCLAIKWFPGWLKYVSTGFDLALVTAIASIGSGSSSPLIFAYFLVLIMAALRFDLLLIRIATAGSCLCYLSVLGLTSQDWLPGFQIKTGKQVAGIEQLIVLAALILAGITLGQMIRRSRSMAMEFHKRQANMRNRPASSNEIQQ